MFDNIKFFDRRVNKFVFEHAYLWTCTFSDGTVSEFQVMYKDFDAVFVIPSALDVVKYFGTALGRLPTYMRKDILTVSIMHGNHTFGGGNNNLLIHTGQLETYLKDGTLYENLMHRAAHISLDPRIAGSEDWLTAQLLDSGNFISTYAFNYPSREDVAETYLVWWALKKSTTQKVFLVEAKKREIEKLIKHRLTFFDNLDKTSEGKVYGDWFKDISGVGWTEEVVVKKVEAGVAERIKSGGIMIAMVLLAITFM